MCRHNSFAVWHTGKRTSFLDPKSSGLSSRPGWPAPPQGAVFPPASRALPIEHWLPQSLPQLPLFLVTFSGCHKKPQPVTLLPGQQIAIYFSVCVMWVAAKSTNTATLKFIYRWGYKQSKTCERFCNSWCTNKHTACRVKNYYFEFFCDMFCDISVLPWLLKNSTQKAQLTKMPNSVIYLLLICLFS